LFPASSPAERGPEGVPALVIFGDKSLREMAMIKPITRQAFATVYGVGDYKLGAYADAFIGAIKRYLEREMAKMELILPPSVKSSSFSLAHARSSCQSPDIDAQPREDIFQVIFHF